jgi:hypothetical protein
MSGLSALHLGVVALTGVGHVSEARRLLADVRARRLGVEPVTFEGQRDEPARRLL